MSNNPDDRNPMEDCPFFKNDQCPAPTASCIGDACDHWDEANPEPPDPANWYDDGERPGEDENWARSNDEARW